MSSVAGLAAYSREPFLFYGRLRAFFQRHPEAWAWVLSVGVWIVLLVDLIFSFNASREVRPLMYCASTGTVLVTDHPAYGIQAPLGEGISFLTVKAIQGGMLHWLLMLVAMMFPLLNEPLRHVAFSVRKKSRSLAVVFFLAGYMFTWALAGLVFLLVPVFVSSLNADQTPFIRGVIVAAGFLLAAIISWLPSRPASLVQCGRTMPVRIHGWRSHADSLRYGMNIGSACLGMCWASMAALLLAHHGLVLMLVATIVLGYERYLLPHTSRLPGYAWMAIALTLFGIEVLA